MIKRWSSFGSGMLAYGIMSNLASRGHYHNHYYGNNYRSIKIISNFGQIYQIEENFLSFKKL